MTNQNRESGEPLAETSNADQNGANGTNGLAQKVATEGSDGGFPQVGTDAWGQMNKRRAELIRKKNRGILTPSELSEYEELQQLSQAALERAFPAPSQMEEKLERLKAKLNNTPNATKE